ncbi:MAG TPA: YigZ family protein [Haloplasmataceae bacterium]
MYLAIKGFGEKEIVINKSRFICSVNRANTKEEALEFIKSIKKTHYNATHNCYAYIIGENRLIQKSSDDGEPSGTAGIPILEVLKKFNLTDTVCVVTRYFGGIKLGASGLIRAYSTSCSETINEVGIIEKKLMQLIDIELDYSQIGLFDNKFKQYDLVNKTYLEKVTYTYQIDIEKTTKFIQDIIEYTNNNIKYAFKDKVICEVDYSN